MLKIKNIKWDTDGDKKYLLRCRRKLISTKTSFISNAKPSDECYEDELLDAVADWLSDEYGFCHGGSKSSGEPLVSVFFALIEPVLACAGYRIMDGDHDTLIIRNNETDTDYEIRVERLQ